MNWVRLWHDMPNDPKWRLIARKSGSSIPEVMAVYIQMMVQASENDGSGSIDGWDDDLAAIALDIDAEVVQSIRETMEGVVLEDGLLTGWEKRQPKRSDDYSTDRVRKHRERKKAEKSEDCNDSESVSKDQSESSETDETPCNADETHGNAQNRTEQNRTEKENTSVAPDGATAFDLGDDDPPLPKTLTESEFDEFWSKCRKNWFGEPGNRAPALKAFKKIKRSEISAERLAELALQDARNRRTQQQRGEFASNMKHASGWLNNRCWDDVQESPVRPVPNDNPALANKPGAGSSTWHIFADAI